MKYLHAKINKIVKLIVEWELVKVSLKFIAFNTLLPYNLRQFAILSLSTLPLQSSVSRIKMRCTISNQPRSILSFFKMNRMRFKVLASQGYITGVKQNMH